MILPQIKPWRCDQCGGILGMVERNSSRQPVLHVLRNVLPAESMLPELINKEEEVICEIEGAAIVYCPVCGNARRWIELLQEIS